MAGSEGGALGALTIRPAIAADEDGVWVVIEPIIRAGQVFALPTAMNREDALSYWLGGDHVGFVAEQDGAIVGTYYIRPNQLGGGSHVANAGYATAAAASGRGIARAMCLDSFVQAKGRGFRAMQYNFVIASNHAAVHLWQSMGFAIVGTLPSAFVHPSHGAVDALVMYREL